MTTCEDDLIRRAACGDQEAFQQLWENHHAISMATALRLCQQRALAEEITQGAFLLAWRGLPRFHEGSPFRPWLMRILYRHALDVMEKQRTYLQPLSLDEGVEIESQAGSPCFIDPQEQVAQREEVGHIEPTILDVVLATGLVRFLSMRRPGYILPRLLLFGAVLFAYVMLILSYLKGIPPNILLIAIGLCIVLSMVVLWIVGGQRRAMAVRADSLMVQWLGRGRACQGLHALADRSRAPSRRRWGELSLTERIGRVCGTQVQLEQERLTLVR